MHNCSVPGCQSYKYRKGINLLYFKFPLNDKSLLKKWLNGIGRRNWSPCENDRICSQHFQNKDIENELGLSSNLKLLEIPTILSQNKITVPTNCTRKILNNPVENTARKTNTLAQPKAVTKITMDVAKSLNTNTGTLDNSSNSIMGKPSGSTNTTKIPVLKITINKKYNIPCRLNEKCYKEPVSRATNKIATFVETNCNSRANINNNDIKVPVTSEKPTNNENVATNVKHDIGVVKTAYAKKGDLSRDITRQTSAERLRYLYTKAQRDCNILRIRLRALRERYRDETEELKKLRLLSHKLPNNFKRKSIREISNEHPKRKESVITIDDTEEENECQKLFEKIKKVKQDMFKQKYPIMESKTSQEQILVSTMSTLHRHENKIKKRSKKLLKRNKHFAVSSIKRKEKIDKVIDHYNELGKVSEGSNTNIESNDNNTLHYEEEYLDPVHIDHH